MAKSLLYAVNTASQTIAAGGTVNFGQPVRRYGCNCRMESGNPIIIGSGYYDISASMTVTASAAGEIVVTLYQDGTAIPGGVYTQEVTTDVWQINMPKVCVRENGSCCDRSSVITAVISGVGATVSLASVLVERV